MNQIIVGIIGGSIVSLISFILGLVGHIWYGKYQDKRRRENSALKKHFQDLRELIIEPYIDTFSHSFIETGEILVSQNAEENKPSAVNFENTSPGSTKLSTLGEYLSKFNEFKMHFSKIAGGITDLVDRSIKHNEQIRIFDNKIKEFIVERSGINVEVEDETIRGIRKQLYSVLYKKASGQVVEERDIDNWLLKINVITQNNEGMTYKIIIQDSQTIQHNAEVELNKIRIVISEALLNPAFINELGEIDSNAAIRQMQLKYTADLLKGIIEKHEKYKVSLKRNKDCATCQIIFGK